jgi:hypothetical protein
MAGKIFAVEAEELFFWVRDNRTVVFIYRLDSAENAKIPTEFLKVVMDLGSLDFS